MRNIILFIFLFFYVNLFSQESDAEIQIINFNSSVSYVSGSSVSVHLDPSGIFDFVNAADLGDDLNNSFILELSGPGGDFDNPTVLNIANDFYTSLINGVLPENLVAGEYKLRIRSTQPELVEETEFFNVINSAINSTPSLSSNIESNSSYTQCLNDNVNLINPFFGSYNQNYNSISGDMPSSNKFFTVTPTSDQSSIEVTIIDVSDGSSVTLNPISGTVYQIPENLSVGTYNIQVHETTTEGFSTFFSSAFIFHTSATIFGNASSETVCVGAEVTFNIDVGDLGIGSNSMGSYYIISFGDGSEDLILTQAQLLELYSDPINPITHIFEEASCTANGNSSFLVSFKLFNKGVDTQCDNYSQNGLGASKDIATAEAPDAQFELEAEQCINEDILVNNTTIPGSYPTTTGECAGDVNYDWQVKKPSFSDFLPVSLLNNSWVSGENLIIPAADVDEIGCWEIKLIAVNPAACLSESQYIGIINIEDIPEANFSPVGDVCENDVINLNGESNIVPVTCDIELANETPTYLWSISPDSGYVLFNDSENIPTTLQSQNPIISFTEAGSYTLTLSVTTECGTDTNSETINVLGNPDVDIELDSMTFCSTSSLLIDFSDQLIPIYSDGFSAPSDYTWTVNGLDIDSNDYAFVNNTSSTDEFPTIQLNSFGTYNITVTAGSNCDTPASDSIIITLSQEPTITNTVTAQDVCSLDPSVQFDLTSDVDGTTYSWVVTENENLSGYEESGTTAFIPSQIITNSTNSDQDLVYTIIPIANGCAGTPFEYTLTVQPVPVVADKDETICNGETFTIEPTDNFPTEIIPIGTTYSWPAPISNPTAVITGGTSASAQSLISQTLSNSSDYPATLTYSVTPNFNGCDGETFDVVITVNPTVGVDAIPDQVLCNGDNTLAVGFNTTLADNISDDSVIAWGHPNWASNISEDVMEQLTNGTGINQIYGTSSTFAALMNDGSVVSWASLANFPQWDQYVNNVQDQLNSGVIDIVANADSFAAIKDNGSVVTWGYGVSDPSFPFPGISSGVIKIKNTYGAFAALKSDGSVVAWGGNQGGDTSSVSLEISSGVVDIFSNGWAFAALKEDGSVVTWGAPTATTTIGQVSNGADSSSVQAELQSGVIDIASASDWFAALKDDGSVVTWGAIALPEFASTFNAVQDQLTSNISSIYPIFNFPNGTAKQAEQGGTFVAIKSDGSVVTWGPSNDCETCISPYDEPTATKLSSEIIKVFTGSSTVAALKSDGSLVTWGESAVGGDSSSVSAQLSSGVIDVVAGTDSMAALKDDGSVVIWGTNIQGDLPQINSGAIALYNTSDAYAALMDDGTIEVWGNGTASSGPQELSGGGFMDMQFNANAGIAWKSLTGEGTISYTWTNDNTDIGLAASGVGNIPSFTTTNSTTAPITANITVSSVYTYNDISCEGESETFSITINPSPQVNFSEDEQFITSGDTTAPVSLSSPTSGVTFSWTAEAEDGITGLTTTLGTDTIPTETLFNTTTEPQTVTYTAIATGDVGFDCEGLPTDYVVTVNPLAQVNPVEDQVVCNDENLLIEFTSNITGGTTTYTWTNDNIEIGLAAEGSGNLDFVATNNLQESITANITVTPTFENGGNSNEGNPIDFSITVNPSAHVESVGDIVVSNGTLIGPIDFTTLNTGGITTFEWTNDNTAIGLSDSGTESILEFTGANEGDEPINATIEVIPSFEENDVVCYGDPINFIITINPDAQVNEIDDLVYNDGDLVQIPFSSSNSGGENTYEWTSTDPSTGMESSGSGNIEFIATNTGNSPIVTTVTVTPTFENGGVSNSGNPETFTITVNPVPQVELIQNSIICAGEEVEEIDFSTLNTGGTTTYAWTNDNPAIGLAASGVGDIASFTAINNTISTIVATIEVTPTFENGGISNTGNPETFTITVNPGAQVDSVVDQVLCNGELTNDILFTTTNIDGTTTYAWTNDNPAIGLAASGTGDIPSFTAINNTTSTIVATVEVTPTYENGGVTCAGNPETFTITVNPDAQVDSVVDQVLCVGELTNDILFTTTNTDGTTTYAWTNDNPAIGLAASGTGDIPSFVVAGSSSGSEIATIEVTPTYENGGVTCVGNPETFTITVNPGAQVDSVVDQVLCNGELTNDILFTTTNIDGTTTYAWTNDNPAIGLAASGTGDIPSFTAINNTTSTIVATVEVTPTYENGGVTCAGNPETFTITVNPDAQVDSVVDQVLCVGELTNDILFTTTNTDGTTTYAWTNDNPAIGLAASGTGDIPSFVVAGSSSGSEIATIEVTPTYENGGVTCVGNPETFTITVNPGAQVDSVVDQVLCNGELTNDILFTTTNIDGTTTYAWTNDNPAIGLAASGTGDIPSFTAINNTTSTIVATVEVTPTYENGGVTCAGNPETFTITVNPDAQVDSVVDQVLCVGELTNDILFTTTNTDGTTTYAWTNDNPAIGLAASGTGDIPSFVVAGSSSGSEIATIEVTPTYENGGVTCVGNPETFTITVNPGAQVDSVVDQVLCNGELTNDILFTTTNIDGTTTYAWTNDNPAIGLAASGTGDIPSFTAINNTTSTIVATVEVTPTYENGGVTCAGNPETFTISVLSDISITSFNITDAIDCNNPFSGAIDITVSGGSGIYDFLWSNGATSQNLTAVTSGDYFVTITDNEGCAYTSNVFNIFRQQDLVVNLTTQTLAVCETSLVTQQNNISISGGLPPYEISWSAGAVSLGDNTEMTAYEDGVYNVLVTDQYGCEVDTEIIVDLDDLSVNGASFDYVSIGTLNCGLGVLEEIEFTNTSDGDVLGVTWDFGDGSPPVSGDVVTHQYTTVGEFEATITVQYNYGCIEVYTEEIEVADGFGIMLPTAFSPNNDGINDTMKPVYNCVNDINMSVYDTLGSLIYYENNINLQGWNGLLDGKQAENGNYLIVVNGTTIFGEEINLKGVFVLLR